MFSHHRDVVCMVNFLNTIRLATHDPQRVLYCYQSGAVGQKRYLHKGTS
jgi:hypothetical protein